MAPIVFLSSLIIAFTIIKKRIKLSFSEILSYHLIKIFDNIHKYNGKNKHFEEECFKFLDSLDTEIYDYIRTKQKESKMDFDYEKITTYLKKLQESNKKVEAFFKDYEKNKNVAGELGGNYLDLAHIFHVANSFPKEAYEYIDNLEKIDIILPQKKTRIIKTIKKYVIDSKLLTLIIFCSIFTISVWFLPDYFGLVVTKEWKLAIIIPIDAIALLTFLFPGRFKEKNNSKIK